MTAGCGCDVLTRYPDGRRCRPPRRSTTPGAATRVPPWCSCTGSAPRAGLGIPGSRARDPLPRHRGRSARPRQLRAAEGGRDHRGHGGRSVRAARRARRGAGARGGVVARRLRGAASRAAVARSRALVDARQPIRPRAAHRAPRRRAPPPPPDHAGRGADADGRRPRGARTVPLAGAAGPVRGGGDEPGGDLAPRLRGGASGAGAVRRAGAGGGDPPSDADRGGRPRHDGTAGAEAPARRRHSRARASSWSRPPATPRPTISPRPSTACCWSSWPRTEPTVQSEAPCGSLWRWRRRCSRCCATPP